MKSEVESSDSIAFAAGISTRFPVHANVKFLRRISIEFGKTAMVQLSYVMSPWRPAHVFVYSAFFTFEWPGGKSSIEVCAYEQLTHTHCYGLSGLLRRNSSFGGVLIKV